MNPTDFAQRLLLPCLLAVTSSAAAQVANDECANATPLSLGSNPFQTLIGATPSPVTWGGTAAQDIWLRYDADYTGQLTLNTCTGAGFPVRTEVFTGTCAALTPVATTSVFCGPYYGISSPSWSATAGTTYYVRAYVSPFDRPSVFVPRLAWDAGLDLVGVAESTSGAGTLASSGGAFQAGDHLRWNHVDRSGRLTGNFAATVMNLGDVSNPLRGVTPGVPGYEVLWSGSMPMGSPIVFGPYGVGGGDESVQVPAGIFASGDTVRIQGVALDPARPRGALPILPSNNTIEWVYGLTCLHAEGFEGIPAVFGSVPTGWSNPIGPVQVRSSVSSPEGSQHIVLYTQFNSQGSETIELISPAYSSAGVSVLEFQLGRLGPNCESLTVYVGDGSGFPTNAVATFSGFEPNGQTWTLQRVPLSGLGANVQVRFGYRSRGGDGDIGIDGFCLR